MICESCFYYQQGGRCRLKVQSVRGTDPACACYNPRANPEPHSWYRPQAEPPKKYRIEGIDRAKPYKPDEWPEIPVNHITHEITAQILEGQEHVIQSTVQKIGGKTFEDITFDRAKIVEALTMYRDRDQYEKVVRCKNCKYHPTEEDEGECRCPCPMWDDGDSGWGSHWNGDDDGFCSFGEEREESEK